MKILGREMKLSELPSRLAGYAANKYRDVRAPKVFKKWRGKTVNGRIKVGFLVQMPQVWDKQESLYRMMAQSKDFEPWLIIVPAYDFSKEKIGDYGTEKEYFLSACGGENCIIAWDGSKWADLKSMRFDYVFYQRPYDHYLPRQYQTDALVSYTKICYIPYATPEMRKTGLYPGPFMRNIYLGFMEDEGAAEINNKAHPHEGHTSFYSLGYPAFEKALKAQNDCAYTSVLWTPRWSVASSHFLQYHKHFEDLDWTGKVFTVRPHPLMWSNFEKTGKLSADEAADIRSLWKEKGIAEDTNASVEDSFKTTDILISDMSSIIAMFFMSGKPIIFCPVKKDFGSMFSALLPGLYVADSWEELSTHLNMLLSGKDPLAEKRKTIIDTYFAKSKDATGRIFEKILEDARGIG